MTTIENIERVLRQLEALQPRTSKYRNHNKKASCHPGFLIRNFLSDLVEVNQQVKIDQCSNFRADSKPKTIKGGQKRMYRPERTSALSTIQTNHRETSSPTIRKRPFIFCSPDQWNSDCDIYSTVKGRMKCLKILKKCTLCLKDSHHGQTCKARKRCFYCKASHNSALCEKRSTPTLNIMTLPKKQGSIYLDKKEGSQLSFISKKLSSQLQLAESDHRNMLVAPLGTKESLSCPTVNAQLSMRTVDNGIITINTHVVEYLTQEIKVVDIPAKEQCEDLTSDWDKPDILIGADCFFNFVDSQDITSWIYYGPFESRTYDNGRRLEMIGIHESPAEDDDERAIDHFNKTIIKLDGRYQVCWPWKDSKQRLSNNYGLCIEGLKNLVRRLYSSSHLHDYDNTIKNQLLKGVIEEVPPNDEVGVVHYLPHHEESSFWSDFIALLVDCNTQLSFGKFWQYIGKGDTTELICGQRHNLSKQCRSLLEI
uniref:DUF1758 domain-containing protein n=1 Tax=Loa loa TaxID=7209 RepID=A0A1I7V7V8_LOALO